MKSVKHAHDTYEGCINTNINILIHTRLECTYTSIHITRAKSVKEPTCNTCEEWVYTNVQMHIKSERMETYIQRIRGMYANMHIHAHTYTHSECMHTNSHKHISQMSIVYAQTYRHTHTDTHIYMKHCVCTHIQTHTYRHTRTHEACTHRNIHVTRMKGVYIQQNVYIYNKMCVYTTKCVYIQQYIHTYTPMKNHVHMQSIYIHVYMYTYGSHHVYKKYVHIYHTYIGPCAREEYQP